MPPESGREGRRTTSLHHGELQGERVHLRAVAGGWRVRKCHFRGFKHLRAVKIFPLARLACGQPGEAHVDMGLID